MKFKNNHEESLKKSVNLHEGHRTRLRNRLDKGEFADIDDYEAMEYILTLVIKRRDTNNLAHTLINQFGSLAGVLDASENELKTVKGVTPTVAYFLHHVPNIFRNYKLSKLKPRATISCPSDVFNYLGECVYHLPHEEFYIICLDNASKVISYKMIGIGGNSQVSVNFNNIVQYATKMNAAKIILLHNHPTGEKFPSVEDMETTKRLFISFSVAGIELYDHIITDCTGDYYSFAREGLIEGFNKEYKKILGVWFWIGFVILFESQ